MLYKNSDAKRIMSESEENDVGRSAFRRDYGRLLHSPSFRRLQGKTQLFPGHESDFFRNRLTHSLEVAQIAKGIAQQINVQSQDFSKELIDLDLVEFAGLAHDLGHPPFGHNGEKALDDCMKRYGGFEGNAQTLRILSKVEKKVLRASKSDVDGCFITAKGEDRRLGLNLSYRSLASILKYDRKIPSVRAKKSDLAKGYYASEAPLVQEIKRNVGPAPKGVKFKTIECQIMDIADDIAYSTYDLEDAMKGGFTHPLELLTKLGNKELLGAIYKKVKREVTTVTREEVFVALRDLLEINVDNGLAVDVYTESKLIASDGNVRSKFTSELVGAFMRGVSAKIKKKDGARFAEVAVARETKVKIESLKHLNYLLTIMSPRLKVVEYRGYEVITTIFSTLSSKNGHLLLPDDLQLPYQRLKKIHDKRRLICDFVSGMTDQYAVEFYGRLKESGASIFKPI